MGLVQCVDLLVFQRVGMGFGMGLGESDCEFEVGGPCWNANLGWDWNKFDWDWGMLGWDECNVLIG